MIYIYTYGYIYIYGYICIYTYGYIYIYLYMGQAGHHPPTNGDGPPSPPVDLGEASSGLIDMHKHRNTYVHIPSRGGGGP